MRYFFTDAMISGVISALHRSSAPERSRLAGQQPHALEDLFQVFGLAGAEENLPVPAVSGQRTHARCVCGTLVMPST
jgi:hypothetical protein